MVCTFQWSSFQFWSQITYAHGINSKIKIQFTHSTSCDELWKRVRELKWVHNSISHWLERTKIISLWNVYCDSQNEYGCWCELIDQTHSKIQQSLIPKHSLNHFNWSIICNKLVLLTVLSRFGLVWLFLVCIQQKLKSIFSIW